MDENLPIEIAFEKVRNELLYNANTIARKYQLPSSLLAVILSEVAKDLKLSAYESIIANYDISVPAKLQRPKEANDVSPRPEQQEES